MSTLNPYVLNTTRLSALTLRDRDRLESIAARWVRIDNHEERLVPARAHEDIGQLLRMIGVAVGS